MTCKKCGTVLAEGAAFCHKCGSAQNQEKKRLESEAQIASEQKNGRKKYVRICAGTALVIVVTAIAVAGMNVFGIFKSEQEDLADGSVKEQDYMADGQLDLSNEDLMEGITDIDSLDSDGGAIVDNYLDTNTELADVSGSAEGEMEGNTPEEGEIPGEAVFTSNAGGTVLSDAKLLKEQTRAKNKEALLEIINSAGLTDGQKQAAVDKMVAMTAIAEKEAAAEILLEAKGFQDVVVSINGDAVDVVVNAPALDDIMRAQIEDIVKRKTEVPAENIIISNVAQ